MCVPLFVTLPPSLRPSSLMVKSLVLEGAFCGIAGWLLAHVPNWVLAPRSYDLHCSPPSVSIESGYPRLLLLHTPVHPPLPSKWALVVLGFLHLCDCLSRSRVCQHGKWGVGNQGKGVSPNGSLRVQPFQEFQRGPVIDPLIFHWRAVGWCLLR